MSDTVGGPTLHGICRPATIVVPAVCARRFAADRTFRLENTNPCVVASRGHVEAGRALFQSTKNLGRRLINIRDGLERKLLRMSVILMFVGSLGWCWPVLNELRSIFFGFASRGIDAPAFFLLPAFESLSGKSRF